MRIVQVIQELTGGGAERVVGSLSSGARARGHQVTVVAASPAASDEHVVPLPLIRRSVWRAAHAASVVRRTAAHSDAEVIHAHNPGVAAAVALATRRGRARPALVTMHGVQEEDYGRAARILRLAGLPVVAAGPGIAAALAERGLAVRRTIVNGVPPPGAAPERAALMREWGLPPGARLVLGVGRLVPQKNFSAALRAVSKVPDAALVIVGDGPLRGQLEEEIGAFALHGRALLIGPRADARELIAAADAVVMPSVWEGLPLVALEALATGTPLVATRARGLRELLRDGDDALLTPPDDDDALAGALRRVLAEPALAARLGAEGRRTAERYSEQAMVEAYLALYEEIA
jgi:glycosyltransferase involved in cell wall biosynthesis